MIRTLQGNNFGHVRFETAQQASDAVEKLPGDDGKLDICGCSATLRKLEGAEEEKYLRQVGCCNFLPVYCNLVAKHCNCLGVKAIEMHLSGICKFGVKLLCWPQTYVFWVRLGRIPSMCFSLCMRMAFEAQQCNIQI